MSRLKQSTVPVRVDAVAGDTLATPSLKRRLFDFFNKGAGRLISTRLVDLDFQIWRLRHPGATFADYYAGSIAARLRRGGTHKTLGARQFLSASLLSAAAERETSQIRDSGRPLFEVALRYGLRPGHTCVDYGCGSLRLGALLIPYLSPGCYWGLDLVSDFYEQGKTLLPSELLRQRRPQLHVIDAEAIERARRAEPDLLFSFSVLRHIPPDELDSFFRNVLAVMSEHTRAVISFRESAAGARAGAKIWSQAREEIEASVRRQDPRARCSFASFAPGGGAALPRRALLLLQHGREGGSGS